MRKEKVHLVFNVGYGWWKPAASKMRPLQDMRMRDDPKKGLQNVQSFIEVCIFYQRHIQEEACL